MDRLAAKEILNYSLMRKDEYCPNKISCFLEKIFLSTKGKFSCKILQKKWPACPARGGWRSQFLVPTGSRLTQPVLETGRKARPMFIPIVVLHMH